MRRLNPDPTLNEFLTLPNEVLARIFSFLPTKDLPRALLTHSTFKNNIYAHHQHNIIVQRQILTRVNGPTTFKEVAISGRHAHITPVFAELHRLKSGHRKYLAEPSYRHPYLSKIKAAIVLPLLLYFVVVHEKTPWKFVVLLSVVLFGIYKTISQIPIELNAQADHVTHEKLMKDILNTENRVRHDFPDRIEMSKLYKNCLVTHTIFKRGMIAVGVEEDEDLVVREQRRGF